jgi:hypothetical protein
MNMFATLDKAEPDTENIRGLNVVASCVRLFKCLDCHCRVSFRLQYGDVLFPERYEQNLYMYVEESRQFIHVCRRK